MKPKQPLDIDALVAEAVPPRPNAQLVFTVPVKLVSEANEREHWRTRHNRKKRQQQAVDDEWPCWTLPNTRAPVELPCVVRLTRIGPKRLDADNLAGSFKHVQDEVARQLGVDDGDMRVRWEYAQVAVGKRVYQVRVEIA